jgi:hypothetical protein
MKNIVSIPKSQKGMKSAMSAEKESRNEDFTQDIIFNSNNLMFMLCILCIVKVCRNRKFGNADFWEVLR